jgi:hypothetical protein
VPHATDVKSDFALAVHHPGAFIQPSAQEHDPEHLQQMFLG